MGWDNHEGSFYKVIYTVLKKVREAEGGNGRGPQEGPPEMFLRRKIPGGACREETPPWKEESSRQSVSGGVEGWRWGGSDAPM